MENNENIENIKLEDERVHIFEDGEVVEMIPYNNVQDILQGQDRLFPNVPPPLRIYPTPDVVEKVDKSGEIWRYIPGSQDCWCSSRGNFKKGRKKLVQRPDTEGYLRVSVTGVGRLRAHQFIAKMFCYNDDPTRIVVDHRNAQKNCNIWWNVRWFTYSENSLAAVEMGLYCNGGSRFNRIVAIKNHEAFIFDNQNIAARCLGFNNTQDISKVLHDKMGKAHGWTFAYLIESNKRDDVLIEKGYSTKKALEKERKK